MTVHDIYLLSLGLLAENEVDATDYEPLVPPIMNIMLPELFEINNSIRLARGLTAIDELPAVSAMADDVPYEAELTVGTLPYGLAAKLALDDEASKAAYFNSEYMEKKLFYMPSRQVETEDLY